MISVDALPSCCMTSLRAVAEVAPESFITGGIYFFPFCAGKYGPSVAPVETEVLISHHLSVRDVQDALEALQPDVRWQVSQAESIVDAASDGITSAAVGSASLVAACGGVRLENGVPTYHFAHPEAFDHLQRGLLAPSGSDLSQSRHLAQRLLAQFPGLRADFLGYVGKTLPETYEEIHQAVQENEHGGRANLMELLPSELGWADAIRQWHRVATPAVTTVPIPPRASLPAQDPWTADDPQFREWLIDQTQVRVRRLPADAFLHEALALQCGDQKTTHQGWETYQHAIMTMLVLETDHLDPADRRALRVAALLHDIGKVYNVWTPGCHALVGAKLWQQHKPSWLTDAEVRTVTFLIRTHDLLGLMDRAIVNPEYRGGLSPSKIRQEMSNFDRSASESLKLMSTMYQADVSSVAALRWLLPLTPLLESLIQEGIESPTDMR